MLFLRSTWVRASAFLCSSGDLLSSVCGSVSPLFSFLLISSSSLTHYPLTLNSHLTAEGVASLGDLGIFRRARIFKSDPDSSWMLPGPSELTETALFGANSGGSLFSASTLASAATHSNCPGVSREAVPTTPMFSLCPVLIHA